MEEFPQQTVTSATATILQQAKQQKVQPGFYKLESFGRDDELEKKCNFDRLMEATFPRQLRSSESTLLDLIQAYHPISLNGLQLELFDDRKQDQKHLYTFMPSLSSLFLMTRGSKNKHEKKASKVIEFHESLPPYRRKPLSQAMLEEAKSLIPGQKITLKDSSSSSTISSSNSVHERRRDTSIGDLLMPQYSWFAILWTCQKQVSLRNSHGAAEFDHSSQTQQPLIQFLVFYKLKDKPEKKSKSDLEIIGMLSSKMERESFWVTPS